MKWKIAVSILFSDYRRILLTSYLIFHSSCFALENNAESQNPTPVEQRQIKEQAIPSNFFALQLYKPTYILPYYFTGTPDNAAYESIDRTVQHSEIKYQISFKVPLYKNILNTSTSLYLGYTQLSYWQLYIHDPFFRETDYEPDLFLSSTINTG